MFPQQQIPALTPLSALLGSSPCGREQLPEVLQVSQEELQVSSAGTRRFQPRLYEEVGDDPGKGTRTMIRVGRDLKNHPVTPPSPGQGHLPLEWCSGLTMAGCQAPTEAALSLPSAAGWGEKI